MTRSMWRRVFPNVGAAIVVAGTAWWGYVLWRTSVGLQRGKYTIGYVSGRTVLPGSGWSVQYRFTVEDALYTGSAPEETDMNTATNARYLVLYDSTAPDWHQIYYEDPIPDSIRRAPRNGWRWRPWPDPAHPELSSPPRPARDSAEAAMWREMAATKASADSLTARNQRE